MAESPSPSELQQLLDKEAIRELVYQYAEGIDRRDGEARSFTCLHAVHKAKRDGRIVDEMIRPRYLDRLVRYRGQWRFAER